MALATFTLAPPLSEGAPASPGRPYPSDKPRPSVSDPRIRRLFGQPTWSKRQQTVAPIRSIDDDTGRVDLFGFGDQVAVPQNAPLGSAQRLAAYLGVFHRLGWGDVMDPTVAVGVAYHSFLLAFDFDTAETYNWLEMNLGGDATTTNRMKHYLRSNYWYCRVRCCDFSRSTNIWVNCTPEESYRRAFVAVTAVLSERAKENSGSGCIGARLMVYPEGPNAPREYALRLFRAGAHEASHASCDPSIASALRNSTERANSAAREQVKLLRNGHPPIGIPSPAPASIDKIRFGMSNITFADTIPSGSKASGDSIRADGDFSSYADEWEQLMASYDPKSVSSQRAKHIVLEMTSKGYTPKTMARV